jgi:hypothetical protein
MVYVTEAARRHLRVLRAATQLTRPATMPRIALRARGQLGLFRSLRVPQDTVIYHDGTPLLLLEPSIAEKLDRTVIHCRHGRGKPQLVITRLDTTPEDQRGGNSDRRPTGP